MTCIKLTVLLSALAASTYASPMGEIMTRDDGKYVVKFCEVGDSWASGVAWQTFLLLDNTYDHNAGNCLRVNHASAIQMVQDSTWFDSSKFQLELAFQACSGSRLDRMRPQMDTCDSPRFAIMTAGGNNALFFEIATNCIYHQDDKDYGPDFHDDHDLNNCQGECCKSLKRSQDYITSQTWSSGNLPYDIWATIDDMLNSPQAHNDKDFKLYVTGYVNFWSTADGSEWCNQESFIADPSKSPKPMLSLELRTTMNDLVGKINDLYKDTITKKFQPQKVGFVDINPNFEKHRFCEPGSNHNAQYYDDNVYLWNLSPPFFTPAPGLVPNVVGEDPSVGPLADDQGDLPRGWRMRPFHPKQGGHMRIKDAVILAVKGDFVL